LADRARVKNAKKIEATLKNFARPKGARCGIRGLRGVNTAEAGCRSATRRRDGRPETRKHAMFELERFIDDCRAALKEAEAPKAIREVVARAVADPAGMLKALGEPTLSRSSIRFGPRV
jgi:hypothetical protein